VEREHGSEDIPSDGCDRRHGRLHGRAAGGARTCGAGAGPSRRCPLETAGKDGRRSGYRRFPEVQRRARGDARSSRRILRLSDPLGIPQATAYFAQAAKEASLECVVNMSQKSAREDAKSHAMCDHWLAERLFDWCGLTVAHLRDFRKTLESLTPLGRIGQTEVYRAGGGLLRFIRFEMDHRRNTTHRGRPSLGIYKR